MFKYFQLAQQCSPFFLQPTFTVTSVSTRLLSMLTACLLCQNQGSPKETRGKEESERAPVSFSQSRDFSVRIVHAGGKEELYQYSIQASYLTGKYPSMCVARPEVFRNPLKALVKPDEDLLVGHKYLLIPSTTVEKLKKKYKEKIEASGAGTSRDVSLDISGEVAKDYVTRGKKTISSRDPKRSGKGNRKVKKGFAPPLPKNGLYRETAWEPSLTSVQELSP